MSYLHDKAFYIYDKLHNKNCLCVQVLYRCIPDILLRFLLPITINLIIIAKLKVNLIENIYTGTIITFCDINFIIISLLTIFQYV